MVTKILVRIHWMEGFLLRTRSKHVQSSQNLKDNSNNNHEYTQCHSTMPICNVNSLTSARTRPAQQSQWNANPALHYSNMQCIFDNIEQHQPKLKAATADASAKLKRFVYVDARSVTQTSVRIPNHLLKSRTAWRPSPTRGQYSFCNFGNSEFYRTRWVEDQQREVSPRSWQRHETVNTPFNRSRLPAQSFCENRPHWTDLYSIMEWTLFIRNTCKGKWGAVKIQ